ncbi:ABC transporter substrate-binding protein [Bacillus swezeyi]|uniref:ABC transporter substrate-binding protein n=1 Tax=Bacillus swezeyi TaxID=1925020 RepID=UPI0027DC5AAC|nr:sugar ABC transporter substrate-binding protein [Bacillus swezeyi]
MRKLHVLTAFFFIVSLMLTACSQSSHTPEADGKAVTLKLMGWEASPLETESVRKGLKAFMEKNQTIKVEYTPISNAQYSSKLLTMLAGDAAPDVFFLGSEDYRAFQKKNVLLDLTGYFHKEYSLQDFIPSSAQIMDIDGTIAGVSSCTVSPVLFYNKDLFKKAGVPLPPNNPDDAWTWAEFVDAAQKLTVKNGGKTEQYGAFGFENNYMTMAEYFSNGGSPFADDFKTAAYQTREIQEVLQSVLDLREKDGAAPEASVLEKIGMRPSQMLQTGKVAMLAEGSWALQELSSMGFPVGVAPLPKFKEPFTHGQAHLHAASGKTKHPEEAWKLISFLSSEEYQLDLVREGLWMPNRQSLYTPEGMKKWYNPDVHPEGFKEMAAFFRDAKPYPNAMVSNNKVGSIITEELDQFYYDGKPVDEVTENIDRRTAEELAKS